MAIKAAKMHNRFYTTAKLMYGTSDLSKLTPTQLDRLTNKTTNTDPNKGKIKGRKYSGKTYGKLKKIF